MPTCGEISKRYKLLSPQDLGLKKRTGARYAYSLDLILRKGLSGRNPDSLRIDEVTPMVIRNWKRSCLGLVTDEDKILSRKRTANGVLRLAKGLFSAWP